MKNLTQRTLVVLMVVILSAYTTPTKMQSTPVVIFRF